MYFAQPCTLQDLVFNLEMPPIYIEGGMENKGALPMYYCMHKLLSG